MGSKMRLSSYCTKRGDNTVTLVMSCKINTRLARPIVCVVEETGAQFHKSLYEQFLLYEFVEPVLNYKCNKFVALTNPCETVPSFSRTKRMVGIHQLALTTQL